MKIRMDVEIFDLEGEPVKNGDEILTIGSVCSMAALNAGLNEKTKGDEKFERYELAKKISQTKVAELTLEDIVNFKKHVGVMYNPLIVGRVSDHFKEETEPKEKEEEKAE